jgi:hypothetical protein
MRRLINNFVPLKQGSFKVFMRHDSKASTASRILLTLSIRMKDTTLAIQLKIETLFEYGSIYNETNDR